jgi:hypothetical protein
MQDGMHRGWVQVGRFSGIFSGYTVQGFKYAGDGGEVGWHTSSWPMRDPIHTSWVSGTDFYKVKVHPPGDISNRQVVEILGLNSEIEPEERSATFEAIKAWETQLVEVAKRLPLNIPRIETNDIMLFAEDKQSAS